MKKLIEVDTNIEHKYLRNYSLNTLSESKAVVFMQLFAEETMSLFLIFCSISHPLETSIIKYLGFSRVSRLFSKLTVTDCSHVDISFRES